MKQKPNPHGEDSAELDKEVGGLPVLRSNVAGVDLGSTTHWVCAPTVDGAAREVETFGATCQCLTPVPIGLRVVTRSEP